jgi:hypothetical protein
MEHSRTNFVRLLTPFRIEGLLPLSGTGEHKVAAENHVLDAPAKKAKTAPAAPVRDEDLERLLKLAEAGIEGVDLGELSDDELDAWIKRH